jgi:ERCC4-related helicase
LCEQQLEVLSGSIPQIPMRLLVGSDGVEHWSDQETWDIVLHNFRVVVSTHAVLADALTHGFVTMERLALLIFDEGMI